MLFLHGIYDVAYLDSGQVRRVSQIRNKVKPLWQAPSRTKRKGRFLGIGPSPCSSFAWHSRKPWAAGKSHSRLRFAHSTRTISTEGCARSDPIALLPAFRAPDTHDLRRGLRAQPANRTLACISRTPHARSPQRVARTPRFSTSADAMWAVCPGHHRRTGNTAY